MADLRPERVNFRLHRADLRPEKANLKPLEEGMDHEETKKIALHV